jgi:hypothetical protein
MSRRSCYVLSLSVVTLVACHDAATEPDMAPSGLSTSSAVTSNTWRQRAKMPSDRQRVITATLGASGGGSFLYAIGGKSVNSTQFCSGGVSKVQAYNGNTNTWSTKTPLPLVLQSSLAGTINGKIYVAGGCSSAFIMEDRLWEYDPAADRWTAKARAPMSLPTPVGSVVDGKLYLFDECSFDLCFWDPDATGEEQFTFFGFYDPATNRWTRRPLPPEGVFPFAGATFTGKLYFLDFNGLVHIYNPGTGAWTTGARRSGSFVGRVTTAVVQSKWYVVDASSLSVYNPATNTWAKRAAPPAAYTSDASNGPTAGRVFAGGIARLELVGGSRPDNNWQYTP